MTTQRNYLANGEAKRVEMRLILVCPFCQGQVKPHVLTDAH